MNQKAIDLASELRYQTASGVHTYGTCSMKGCKHTARGSAHCPDCVTEKLAKEIGIFKAAKMHALYNTLNIIQSEIHELIGEF